MPSRPVAPHQQRRTFLTVGALTGAGIALAQPAHAATDPVFKDELVINVLDHGAKRMKDSSEGPIPAGHYGANDAAFAAAWNLVRPTGGRIYVPAGYYPINKWIMDDQGLSTSQSELTQERRTVRVEIDAAGAVLLANPVVDSAAEGTSVVNVVAHGSTKSQNMLRQFTISGLSIQADFSPINLDAGNIGPKRSGFYFKNIQELHLDNCWVSHMVGSGIILKGVMDSTIIDTQVMWCATHRINDKQSYAIEIFEGVETNANALRFFGLHVEFTPYLLRIDGAPGLASRHVEFVACKFERGQINWEGIPPIHLKNIREISFTSCMFAESQYESIEGKIHPAYLVVEPATYGATSVQLPKGFVAITGCHFTTPDRSASRWFSGGNTHFSQCDFARCVSDGGAAGGPDNDKWAAFDLYDSVSLTDCSFTFAQDVYDGTGNIVVSAVRNDFVRFRGKNSAVVRPTIYFPAARATPGALITVSASASQNSFLGFRDVFRGVSEGPQIPMPDQIRYEDGSNQLGTRVRADAIYQNVTKQLPAGTPTVFGVESATLLHGPYTDFRDGYEGQMLWLIVGWGVETTIVHDGVKVITLTRQNLVLPAHTFISFVRIGGGWRQV